MFKVLDKVCQPTRGSKFSAGIDLYAREDVVIGAGETEVISLGVMICLDTLKKQFFYDLAFDFEDDSNFIEVDGMWFAVGEYEHFLKTHHIELFNRSSTALKRGLILANGTGIIDLDYEDEICAILHNPMTNEYDETPMYQDSTRQVITGYYKTPKQCHVKKGDKICQIILKENKTYMMGIESDEERTGGFGSTGR